MYVTNLQVSFLNARPEIYNFIYKLTSALFCIVKQQKKRMPALFAVCFLKMHLSLFALSLQRI